MTEWIAAAVVALGVLLCGGAWALSSPVGSSPDDSYHLSSIWCIGATDNSLPCRKLPEPAEGAVQSYKVPAMVAGPQCYAFDPTASAVCQEPLRGKRAVTTAVNSGDYPGGFYTFMHTFVGSSVVKSVVTMRMVNVLITALLLTAIGLACAPAARRMLAYAVTVTLIPLGWFIIGSVNPSSWAIVGVTAWGFALNGLFTAPSRRRGIALGALGLVGALMAIGARGDAAVYVVVTGVAVCILHWRTLWTRKWLAAIPAAAFLIAAFVSLTAGQVGSIAGASAETDRPLSEVLTNVFLEWPALISGSFGYSFGLGWLDTAVPTLTAYPVAMILGFVFLSGFSQGRWSKVLACLAVGIPLIALPSLTYYRLRMIVGETIQPRYILPLIPVLVGLALAGRVPGTSIRFTRVQGAVFSGALSLATSAALYANIRRYVTGTDGTLLIDNLEWWWPWAPSPFVIIALGGVGFAMLSSPVWLLSRPAKDNESVRLVASEDDSAALAAAPPLEPAAAEGEEEVRESWLPAERKLGVENEPEHRSAEEAPR
nr:DUF2142 domain-containing protein [Nocardioides soli]